MYEDAHTKDGRAPDAKAGEPSPGITSPTPSLHRGDHSESGRKDLQTGKTWKNTK